MGILFVRNDRDETKLGIWKVEESIEELKTKLLLNEEELRFFNSLNKNKRNIHWLSSRVLLRHLLNTDDFIEVYGDEHGKPHLVNFDYKISISHSYDYAAAMISKKQVGVDIEKRKPVIAHIARKFLHEKELSQVDIQTEHDKLYVYWCAKEAVYKMNGKKGLLFRENIVIEPFDFKPEGDFIKGIYFFEQSERAFCIKYELVDGYMLAYVINE